MSELKLRDYQADSLDLLREGFVQRHKRQVLALPTGGGKSVSDPPTTSSHRASERGSYVSM